MKAGLGTALIVAGVAAAVIAFFLIGNYQPGMGLVENAMGGSVVLLPGGDAITCVASKLPGAKPDPLACGVRIPYRFVAAVCVALVVAGIWANRRGTR